MDVDDDDFVGPREKLAEKKNSGDEVFADINFPQPRPLSCSPAMEGYQPGQGVGLGDANPLLRRHGFGRLPACS